MLAELSKSPHEFASAVAHELGRRAATLEVDNIDNVVAALVMAGRMSAYSSRAKAFLTQPLRDRKIPFDPQDWRSCGIKLYALWQSTRPAEVERRMAELREKHKNAWRDTFPDDWNIDEQKLRDLYRSGPELLVNGIHAWNETSIALRYYVAEQLAPLTSSAPGAGFFDWGGSDGITCLFARHHGARNVHLFEPNANAQALGKWMVPALRLDDIHFHTDDPELPPKGQRFAAGVCTEVLEHVVDPPRMMRQFYELLSPGGVIFVTSSFGVPQDTHLKSNLKYAGKEKQMMQEAGFKEWTPPLAPPCPFLPSWGFWLKP